VPDLQFQQVGAAQRWRGDGVGATATPSSGRGRPSYNEHRPAAMATGLVPPRTHRAGGGPPTTSTDRPRCRWSWCRREPIGPGAALLQRAPTRSDGDGIGATANPSGRGRPSYRHRFRRRN